MTKDIVRDYGAPKVMLTPYAAALQAVDKATEVLAKVCALPKYQEVLVIAATRSLTAALHVLEDHVPRLPLHWRSTVSADEAKHRSGRALQRAKALYLKQDRTRTISEWVYAIACTERDG